jgi:hypothetical protein
MMSLHFNHLKIVSFSNLCIKDHYQLIKFLVFNYLYDYCINYINRTTHIMQSQMFTDPFVFFTVNFTYIEENFLFT